MRKHEFIPENFKKVEVKFNIIVEHLFSFIFMGLAVVILGTPFFLIQSINPQDFIYDIGLGGLLTGASGNQRLGLHAIVVVIGVVIHELIHCAFYARHMKNGFRSVKIGFKFPFAYAESKEIMRTNQFIVGLIMPMIILGIIPTVIAMVIGNSHLLLFGIVFTVAGSSDTLIFFRIFKNRKSTWFENLPSINKYYLYMPK